MVKLIQKSGFIKPGGAAGYIKYIATRDGVETIPPGPDGYLEYMATRPGAERHGEHGLFSNQPVVSLSDAMNAAQQHSGPVWTFIYSLRREDAARLGYDNAEGWRKLIKAHQVELANAMKIPPEQFRWYAAYHDAGEHPHIHMTVWSDDPKQGYLTKDGIKAMRSTLTNSIFQDELYSLYQRKDISYKDLIAQARETMRELVQQMESSFCDNLTIEMQMLQLAHLLENVSGKKVYGYLKKPIKAQVDLVVDELAKLPQVAECYETWSKLRDELESYYKDTPRQHLPLSRQKEFRAIKNMVIQEAENLRRGVLTFEGEHEHLKRSAWNEYLLGKRYLVGDGVPKDTARALEHLNAAAEHGNSQAQYILGKLYLLGKEVEQDRETAAKWFTAATAQGHKYAQFFLERMEQSCSPSLILCTTRLLGHMAQIIRDTPPPSLPAGLRIDRKRFQELQEKRITMGHKPDDHEDYQGPSLSM